MSEDHPEEAPDEELAAASLRAVTALFATVKTLVWGLARDARLSRGQRLKLKLVGLWLSSPIDAIPDWLPVVGYMDDMLLAAVALNRVVSRVPTDVVREHWPSAVDYRHAADRIVSAGATALPRWISRHLFIPRRRPTESSEPAIESDNGREAEPCSTGEKSSSQ